jgi:hypothetical protein
MTWPVISCQSKTFGLRTLTEYICKNLDPMKRIRSAVSLLRASGRTLSLTLQLCTQVKGSSDFINGSFDVQLRPLMGNWERRQKHIRHAPHHRIHRNSLRQWSSVQTHYYGRSRYPLILWSVYACNYNVLLRNVCHRKRTAYCNNRNMKVANRSFQNAVKFKHLKRTVIIKNLIHDEIKKRLKSGNIC